MRTQIPFHLALSCMVLLSGLSFAGATIVYAEGANAPSELERFCNPPSGPPRPCPQTGPVGPSRQVTPEEHQRIEERLHEKQAEYDARPKPPLQPTGIFSGKGVDSRFEQVLVAVQIRVNMAERV